MINVNVRHGNQIITLVSIGKSPILARAGSSFTFYNPLELLAISIGACVGGHLEKHCRFHDINLNQFEWIGVDIVNDTPIVTIQHPPEIEGEVLRDLKRVVESCDISRLLVKTIKVEFIPN